jgi:hypothetical protein
VECGSSAVITHHLSQQLWMLALKIESSPPAKPANIFAGFAGVIHE